MDILSNFETYLSIASPLAYIAAFIGGILASFTPCVYPLIPVTVGYIGSRTAGSKRKGFFLSIVYVLGVASTYSILGGIAALTGSLFGQFTQNPWSYILVGNICLILSLSLFEVFGLPLPQFFARRRAEIKSSGLGGAFLVGLVSALVVSPCTAPILGSILLFVAAKKNIVFGMSLLFVFAYGMGVLLILVGTFSGLLASLPKSGEWMNKVKKFFAWFLLLVSEYYFFKAGRLF
jgi:thiol:disulfide interchange protein DsbD